MNLFTQIRLALVDDHSLVRDGIRALLSAIPTVTVVGEAENGEDAMVMVEHYNPDILLVDINLLDINLLDMNGLELTRKIRDRYPTVKVLVRSMYDSKEYVSESLRSGASGYILNNAPSREVVAAIKAIKNGGTFYSAEIAQKLLLDDTTTNVLTPRESQVLYKITQGLNNK